jgi:hypothetical protein
MFEVISRNCLLIFTSESFLFLSAVYNNHEFTCVYSGVKFYSHIKVQYKKDSEQFWEHSAGNV